MIAKLVDDVLGGTPVERERFEEAWHLALSGELPEAAVAGLLVALRSRPPDPGALATLAEVMRRHRRAVPCQVRPLIDTCGTGGDGAGSFNISTAAAFVVAAAGGAVAKHGNRGISSRSGSADVLEELGLVLDVAPEDSARLVDAVGFAFLFAPAHHPLMKTVMPVRRALGVRTIFNLVGPLSNPALADHQVVGVYAPDLTSVVADALASLGARGALVVHCSGLDELGLHDVTRGHRVVDGRVEPFELRPEDAGVARAPLDAVRGGGPADNAAILRRVLGGEPGPEADVVALNAGAALAVAGLADDVRAGVALAREVLARGRAARVLERAVESTRALAAGTAG